MPHKNLTGKEGKSKPGSKKSQPKATLPTNPPPSSPPHLSPQRGEPRFPPGCFRPSEPSRTWVSLQLSPGPTARPGALRRSPGPAGDCGLRSLRGAAGEAPGSCRGPCGAAITGSRRPEPPPLPWRGQGPGKAAGGSLRDPGLLPACPRGLPKVGCFCSRRQEAEERREN